MNIYSVNQLDIYFKKASNYEGVKQLLNKYAQLLVEIY